MYLVRELSVITWCSVIHMIYSLLKKGEVFVYEIVENFSTGVL
jgi:hypothetical protein